MEVQDNSDKDGRVEDSSSTNAIAGKAYPIRLLHFQNGMMIVGYIINVYPETTMVLRPYTVEVLFDPTKNNIEEYEFEPYLDQLAHFSPISLSPVPFMNSSIISIIRPSQHVVENYTGVVRMREVIAITPEEEDIEIFYHRSYPNTTTRH